MKEAVCACNLQEGFNFEMELQGTEGTLEAALRKRDSIKKTHLHDKRCGLFRQ
jgi:hypothetical protein